jgi:hypothetical protein
MKRNMIIAIMITFCFAATLFMVIPIRSANQPYDPWIDYNDDGKINLQDLVLLANSYGTSGAPINKTAIILDLQSRVSALEAQTEYVKTIRFYESNESTNDNPTGITEAAVFSWIPQNATNNAILSVRLYFEYRCEPQGLDFMMKINNLQSDSLGELVSSEYTWSNIYTSEAQLNYYRHIIFPNQANYTIEFLFGVHDLGHTAYVRNVNIILQVIDGLAPS